MLPSFCMPLIHELEESCEKVNNFENLPQYKGRINMRNARKYSSGKLGP